MGQDPTPITTAFPLDPSLRLERLMQRQTRGNFADQASPASHCSEIKQPRRQDACAIVLASLLGLIAPLLAQDQRREHGAATSRTGPQRLGKDAPRHPSRDEDSAESVLKLHAKRPADSAVAGSHFEAALWAKRNRR